MLAVMMLTRTWVLVQCVAIADYLVGFGLAIADHLEGLAFDDYFEGLGFAYLEGVASLEGLGLAFADYLE